MLVMKMLLIISCYFIKTHLLSLLLINSKIIIIVNVSNKNDSKNIKNEIGYILHWIEQNILSKSEFPFKFPENVEQ